MTTYKIVYVKKNGSLFRDVASFENKQAAYDEAAMTLIRKQGHNFIGYYIEEEPLA